MIEVRMNAVDLSRIQNDVLHSCTVLQRLRDVGVPIIGAILMRGVKTGRLEWFVEEDLDGDLYVWRWYQPGEACTMQRGSKLDSGRGPAWEWARYQMVGGPALMDDEL